MPSPIKLHVWGDFACFSRPEMKVERVSYDVITPSAARGVLEAIYWKPQIRWVVERIHVLKPITFTHIRRNEVGSRASASSARSAMKAGHGALGLVIEENRQQRAAMVLRDVGYVIEARFELIDNTETIAKHYNMFKRRAQQGQCFHRPYLGTREFDAHFAWIDDDWPVCELPDEQRGKDMGFMLHDIVYTPSDGKDYDTIDGNTGQKLTAEPNFFRARIDEQGVVAVPPAAGQEVRA